MPGKFITSQTYTFPKGGDGVKHGGKFKERIGSAADLAKKALDIEPLVELAGKNRVLVENHCGITEYGSERIGIKVKHGCIYVLGCGLSLLYMSEEKIVITGSVRGVQMDEMRCK